MDGCMVFITHTQISHIQICATSCTPVLLHTHRHTTSLSKQLYWKPCTSSACLRACLCVCVCVCVCVWKTGLLLLVELNNLVELVTALFICWMGSTWILTGIICCFTVGTGAILQQQDHLRPGGGEVQRHHLYSGVLCLCHISVSPWSQTPTLRGTKTTHSFTDLFVYGSTVAV